MTPEEIIADLDDFARDYGQDVVLRRTTPGPAGVQIPLEVKVRARVTGYAPAELAGNIRQGDSRLILSPTEMIDRQWSWPPRVGDSAVIDGRSYRVEGADPDSVGNQLVRIELQVRG